MTTIQLTFVAYRRRTIAGPSSGQSDRNEVAFPVHVPANKEGETP